ncbi:MAG: MerR family transcriptional regulator [Candidatus Sericytochromatia bacterium]|nr:MerR family transcriptional regulator [Candidatus Sericytochromatia bacterium]
MSLSNCTRCQRAFRRLTDAKICPACLEGDERAYQSVIAWLQQHPGDSLQRVASATGVAETVVLRLVREGRVSLLELLQPEDLPRCRRCGVAISGGMACRSCAQMLGEELQASADALREASWRKPWRGS